MNAYIFPGLTQRNQLLFSDKIISRSIEYQMDKCCLYFKIRKVDMVSRSRQEPVKKARLIAMFLCAENYKNPLELIGKAFNRHHSTVLYSRETCSDWMRTDKNFRYIVEEIKNIW